MFPNNGGIRYTEKDTCSIFVHKKVYSTKLLQVIDSLKGEKGFFKSGKQNIKELPMFQTKS